MGNNLVDEYLNSIENEEEKQKIIELISNNKDLQSLLKVMCDDRTINYDDTKDFDINKINEHCKKYPNDAILVIIPNTKGITSDMLKNLNNHVYIRVEGAYDLTRIGALNQANFFNHKNRVTSAINLFFSSVIYTKDEAIKILEEIENIESKIKNKWSNFQKLVYLYTTLKTKITYDPEYEDSPNSEVRSLRGLITKKAVCAGYSLIFKEFCDRQNIKCYYVGGNGHAWNIVVIEGKHYAVDLTLENTKFRHGTHDSYIYLGQSPAEFNKTHKPELFFFIMRTTTNGMPRYNSNGDFNNSFHVTRNGITPERIHSIIIEWSFLLNKYYVDFKSRSYYEIEPGVNDFMYLDPPYANTKGMYYGTINYDNLWEYLRNCKCDYFLSFDGIAGKENNIVDIPQDIYSEHLLLDSGNSSFRRVIGKDNNVNVYESLYVRKK